MPPLRIWFICIKHGTYRIIFPGLNTIKGFNYHSVCSLSRMAAVDAIPLNAIGMMPGYEGHIMGNRIIGYDLARALAVFGMVVVNFKVVMGAEKNGPEWLVNLMGMLDGRAAATFVILAGAGLSLFTRKGRLQNDPNQLLKDRRTMLKRALFLFIAGALYTPIWPADILHFYGLYIAVAAFLFAVSTRRLWICAGTFVLAFSILLFVFDYEKGWDWSTMSYEGLWTPEGMFRHMFFNGFHPVVPWLSFLLLGMILGRQDLSSPATRRRIFTWGVCTALSAEVLSRILIYAFSEGTNVMVREFISAIFGTDPMPPMPLYMIAGAGTACAVIAASVAFGERYGTLRWLRPFVATGQLALTLYVGHVVVGMGTLELMGRLENQTLPFAVSASLLFCAAGVAFAYLWRTRFKRGPLEALMRALTEPRRQST